MKKFYLEFLRGGAALIVLTYHFLELYTLSNHTGHFYFANWGTDAVIIFFILSGIVINISQTNNPKSRKAFISNRLLRLYPQFAAGLLLGLIVLYITASNIPSIGVIAGNFLMISLEQGYMRNIVPCIATNSPIWSLSFEIVFYLIFALSIGRHQKKIIFCWFILSIAVFPLYYFSVGNAVVKHLIFVMSFSTIWLAGYYIYEFRNYVYADKYTALFSVGALPLISRMHIAPIYYDPAKYLLFALFSIPFFSYCLQVPKSGRKISIYYLLLPFIFIMYVVFEQPYITFASFLVYSSFPFLLMALCLVIDILKVNKIVVSQISKKGTLLGRYSYPLYITHYPVFFLFTTFFHSVVLCFLLSLPLVMLVAYSLENYLQPAVISLFRNSQLSFALRSTLIVIKRSWKPGRRFATIKKLALPLTTAIAWILLLPFEHH